MTMLHDFNLDSALIALCGSGDPLALQGILFALLSAGFIGSFAHCATMCGPFVLMQAGGQRASGFVLRRSVAGLLPFYHLGRLSTYVGLGALAGGFGGSVAELTELHGVLAALLGAAALMFLLQALKSVMPMIPIPAVTFGSRFGAAIADIARPILRGSPGSFLGVRGLALGLVLGFLPCGFLYSALVAAAASGNALAGGAAMAAFGLGTVPALALVGILGAGITQRWRRIAAAALPPIFLLNAVTLAGIALHLAA